MRRLILALLLVLASLGPSLAAKPQRVVSQGGIEAWLVEDHANPIISAEIAWRDSGSAFDPVGKEGLSRLLAGTMDEGAGPYDSQAYQRRLEDLSIKLSFSAGQDMLHASLITLVRNRDSAFDMLRLALVSPKFEESALNRVKGQILAGLAKSSEDPETIASRTWRAAAFAGHAYARQNEGTAESVPALAASDLKAALKRLGRDNMIIGVVGDIKPEELAQLLDRTFLDLPTKAAVSAMPEAAVAAPQEGIKPFVVNKSIPQSVVQFGFQGVKRDDPDWYAAYTLNYILGGGGFTSRLMVEIREKRGLAYSAYSYLYPMDHGAAWIGGVATRNDKVAQSIALVRKELENVAQDGVSAQELADAKTYLTGSFPLRFDSSRNIAGLLVSMQADRLGLDYLDKRNDLVARVTRADLARVAKRLIRPENLIVVVVGSPKGL